MSVLFGKSFNNVNKNYNKKNLFGYLTLLVIINLLPITLYPFVSNKIYYYITLIFMWFLLFCIYITAKHNAIHEKEGVFPSFNEISANLTSFFKNGFYFFIFAIFQYALYIVLFFALNYLLATSMGITGEFKEVMVTILSNLYSSVQAGDFTLLSKEIIISLLILFFMFILSVGNYSNFVYDLKFVSLFDFLRGFKFLRDTKGDTPTLILKAILFFIVTFILLVIFTFTVSFITGIILAITTHNMPQNINPNIIISLKLAITIIVTYIFGFFGIYLFDMIAQYIRTNKEQQIEEQEEN